MAEAGNSQRPQLLWWFFAFAALQAIFGFFTFLSWLGIKPEDIKVPLTVIWPHWASLAGALFLFVSSLGTSLYGMRRLKVKTSTALRSEALQETAVKLRTPSNAAELVWNWRRMVTKAHNIAREEKITFPEALVRDASFPDLRPHLNKSVRDAIEGVQLFRVPQGMLTPMDPLFNSVLEDVDRKAREWGLPTEPPSNAGETDALRQANRQLQVGMDEMQGRMASLQGELDCTKAKAQKHYDIYLEQVQITNREKINVKDAENERDKALRQVEALKNQIETLTKTPQLLVEHNSGFGTEQESLIFINDGEATINAVAVGPILWDTAYRREINLHNVLGPLRAHKQVESKFAVFEQIGTSIDMTKLPPLLREIARKGCEAVPTVTVSYRSMDDVQFSRKFSLAVDSFGRVVWNPGAIRRETDAPEAL